MSDNKLPTILGVIPARYASSRFPGKPLADIAGKSMIERVYEQSKKANSLGDLLVATDDNRIYKHVINFGGKAVMTAPNHPSGTDRCYEALQITGKQFDYVINIQGDEPFISPSQIDLLAKTLDKNTQLATLVITVDSQELLESEGEVKVVLNNNNEAIYFSRSVIPFIKNVPPSEWHKKFKYYRHVGMYAYRADVLAQITSLKPSSLEIAESLEQLRWLENGYKIKVAITTHDSHCIDTPQDIERVLKMMSK